MGSVAGLVGDIAAEKNIPLDVQWELTHACNLDCVHCYLTGKNGPRDELSLPEITRVMDELAAEGTLFLTLTGGEPLMRPDFFDIVAAARERAFAVMLFSNGTLIGPEQADRIASLGVLDVGISIYGANAPVHDAIMRVPGAFDKSLNALSLLRERGVRATLKSTIMKSNFAQRMDIIALAESLGIRYILDPVVSPRNDGSPDALGDRLGVEELVELYGHKHFLPDGAGGPWESGPDPACYAGRNTAAINPRGDVLPCLQFLVPIGNLREQSFGEIWRKQRGYEKFKNIKLEDMESCAGCELRTFCAICPGLALLETGSLGPPCPAACAMAEARKIVHDRRA